MYRKAEVVPGGCFRNMAPVYDRLRGDRQRVVSKRRLRVRRGPTPHRSPRAELPERNHFSSPAVRRPQCRRNAARRMLRPAWIVLEHLPARGSRRPALFFVVVLIHVGLIGALADSARTRTSRKRPEKVEP